MYNEIVVVCAEIPVNPTNATQRTGIVRGYMIEVEKNGMRKKRETSVRSLMLRNYREKYSHTSAAQQRDAKVSS
jgi:hypothetical protein